mgnify:CR=1 FL=1
MKNRKGNVLMAALLLLFWLFTRAYRKSRKEGGR